MSETEYYWKINDTLEEYHGHYTKGIIIIDNNKKVVHGNTSDIAFSILKAEYFPIKIELLVPINLAKKLVSIHY